MPFVCDHCLKSDYLNRPVPREHQAWGVCEVCGRVSGCSDIHHSRLMPLELSALARDAFGESLSGIEIDHSDDGTLRRIAIRYVDVGGGEDASRGFHRAWTQRYGAVPKELVFVRLVAP